MLFPLVVAFVAVFLGAALALGPQEGTRGVAAIRILALLASAGVILTHLLPEAISEVGYWALAAFGLGIAFPALFEAAARKLFGHDHDGEPSAAAHAAGVELAFVGLVAHRFGDGLSMGAYSAASTDAWSRAWVVLAIAAHIVPVTTIMILAVVAVRGARSGALHAAILAASTMAGVVVASLAVRGGHMDVEPWISAAVAGLLVHIVAHDLPWRRRHVHGH